MLSYEGHGLDRGEPHARNVRRRVLREQRVERLVVARDVAPLEERLCEMGPSERATLRDLQDTGEIHRVAERVQFFDHELDAAPSVLAQPAETRLEGRVPRIDEVTEDVRVAPLGFGVELRRWNDLYAERAARCGGLGDPRERVVVRKRLDLHTASGRALHQVPRREGAVRAQ